jgi:hypothetical protein
MSESERREKTGNVGARQLNKAEEVELTDARSAVRLLAGAGVLGWSFAMEY